MKTKFRPNVGRTKAPVVDGTSSKGGRNASLDEGRASAGSVLRDQDKSREGKCGSIEEVKEADNGNEVSVGSPHSMTPEITTQPQETVARSDLSQIDVVIPKPVANMSPPTVHQEGFRTSPSQDERLPVNIFATPSSGREDEHRESAEENPVEEERDSSTNEPSSKVVPPPKEKRTLHQTQQQQQQQQQHALQKKKRSRDRSKTSKVTSTTAGDGCDGDGCDGDGCGEKAAPMCPPPCKKLRSAAPRVREAPDRTTMTMRELIYYNPSANPMSSKLEDMKKKDDVSEPAATPTKSDTPTPKLSEEAALGDAEDERIVPQLRIGKDGNIIIDEQSMMMKTTSQKDTREISTLPHSDHHKRAENFLAALQHKQGEDTVLNNHIKDVSVHGKCNDVIIEGSGHTTSASYRNRHKIAKWSKEETGTFFKALGQVGTDFTMMTLLLPKRSRKELKNKFKKEEKTSPHLISQALRVQQTSAVRT